MKKDEMIEIKKEILRTRLSLFELISRFYVIGLGGIISLCGLLIVLVTNSFIGVVSVGVGLYIIIFLDKKVKKISEESFEKLKSIETQRDLDLLRGEL